MVGLLDSLMLMFKVEEVLNLMSNLDSKISWWSLFYMKYYFHEVGALKHFHVNVVKCQLERRLTNDDFVK